MLASSDGTQDISAHEQQLVMSYQTQKNCVANLCSSNRQTSIELTQQNPTALHRSVLNYNCFSSETTA